jgi:hypothetical protein
MAQEEALPTHKRKASKINSTRRDVGEVIERIRHRPIDDEDDNETENSDDDEEDDDADDEEDDDVEPTRTFTGATPGRNTAIDDDENERPDDEFVGSMYQSKQKDGQDSVRVPIWVAQISRTKAELLVLAQFVYWFGEGKNGKLRAKIKRKGYLWVYKTYKALTRELPLSRGQVVRAIRTWKAAGVLIADDDIQEGHKVYYRLDPGRVLVMIEETPHPCVEENADDDE